MDTKAFFYVDGIPTKGCWVDLDGSTDWDDIKQALADAAVFDDRIDHKAVVNSVDLFAKRQEIAADYGGDILCACCEGIASEFLSSYDTLDLKALGEWLDSDIDDDLEDAARAYIDNIGDGATPEGFQDAYQGEFDTEAAFAEQLAEDIGALPKENTWPLSCIDWDAAARELRIGGDYYFCRVEHGHTSRLFVFRNE